MTRKANLFITYDTKDITSYIDPVLESWTYTDVLSGSADSLDVTVNNNSWNFIGSWMPEKGAILRANIQLTDWTTENKVEFNKFGTFEIDDISWQLSPNEVTFRALSVPESTSLRGEEKNRAWEKVKLSVIGRDIASKSKLKFVLDGEDVDLERVEQSGETDLQFLQRLANESELALKVTSTTIYLISERSYEQKSPSFTLDRLNTSIIAMTYHNTLTGTYRSCKVEYHNPKKGKSKTSAKTPVLSYTFTPPNPPKTGRTLIVKEQVNSLSQAEKLAKSKLREANRDAETISVTLLGNPNLIAGLIVQVENFGKLNGKYIITQASHTQSFSGYQTTLDLRRCLIGY